MKVSKKWRPSIGLVLALVLATVLALPLVGLFFFRIFENQLIRQTESELIGQASVIAAVLRQNIESTFPADATLGPVAPPRKVDESALPYSPISPQLDLTSDDPLGRRPAAKKPEGEVEQVFKSLGKRIDPVLAETQKATLAGFRVLDQNGVVIAGREETGLSLAHIDEVATAMSGETRVVLRQRISSHEPPPLYSWSRGTGLRIFLAMPVVARGRVAAVVYASRTPSNIFRTLYEERQKLAWAGLATAILTLTIWFVLNRGIAKPMRDLASSAVAAGNGAAIAPLESYGTEDFARLSQSFFDMAERLKARSDFVATFAAHVSHELKSPLTAILGAAELLRDDLESTQEMSVEERRGFLDNMVADASRLASLVQRLRDLARAEESPVAGMTTISEVTTELSACFPSLEISTMGRVDETVGMATENLRIALAHLADNAARHGATRIDIKAAEENGLLRVTVADNGTGISPNNRPKVFDQFFTTRRESGGTGMGLPITRAMIRSHGGTMELEYSETGASFVIRLPFAKT